MNEVSRVAGKGGLMKAALWVLLIIKWPDVTKPGSVDRFLVINIIFYTKILQMLGLSAMLKQAKDGISMGAAAVL